MSRQRKTEQGTMEKILHCLVRYRLLLLLSLLLAAGTVVLTLYVPILIGRAIDLIVGKGRVDFSGIMRLLIRIGIVAAITSLLQWLGNRINNRVTFQVIRDIREAAFRKIEVLPLKYIDNHAYGETVNRMVADVDQFADGLLLGFTQLFSGVMTILGTLGFMFRIRWQIALVVVLLTPISLLTSSFITRRTYRLFHLQSEIRGKQTGLIDEMIENQKVVQAFSHEGEAMRRFDAINERLEACSVQAVFFSSITNPATRFINSLVYAGVSLVGGLACVTSGSPFSVGQLASFLSYANQYTKPFNEISGVVAEMQNALACAARIFELIDEPAQTPEAPDAAELKNATGNIQLKDVAFSYTPDRELIRDFSLTVTPGQRIAIVGPTGCGKTTVINLLMRFYDVDAGSIRVEGTDIRDLTRASLRRSFGMVLQETWLKAATIRENLVMGKPDATDEEIVAAAKASHAHGFITRLPHGYDTMIGEEGGGLSQGQKQLLCITRVMLSLPPMLILDEATSSIDTRTELKVQEAFSRLMRGRTSFIVAHRLSTIREADVILVMRDGHIVEQGKHDDLLLKGGFYASIYNSQFAPC